MNQFIETLNRSSESWAHFVWHSSWQSALLASFVIVIAIAFRRLPATLRYSMLVVALIKFAVPPFFASPTGAFSSLYETHAIQVMAETRGLEKEPTNTIDVAATDPTEHQSVNRTGAYSVNGLRDGHGERTFPARGGFNHFVDRGNAFNHGNTSNASKEANDLSKKGKTDANAAVAISNLEASNEDTTASLPSVAALSQLTITSWLVLVHMIGSFALLFVFLYQYGKLLRLKSRSVVVDAEGVLQRFENVSKRMGVWIKPRLMTSSEIDGPICFGFFQPVVILPKNLLDRHSFSDIAMAHELAHIRRLDPWINGLQNLMLVAWWFNPMIWFLNRHVRKLREDCCDDLVLVKNFSNSEDYSQSLIEIAKVSSGQFSGPVSSAFGMADHPLKSRIRRIMNPAIRRYANVTWFGAAVLLLLCLVCLPGISRAIENVNEDPNITNGRENSSSDDTAKTESAEQHTENGRQQDDNANQQEEKKELAKSLKIKVVDVDGNPVANAFVHANMGGTDATTGDPKVVNQDEPTDENGLKTITFFDGSTRLRTWVSKDNYVTIFINWEDRNETDVPEEVTIVLQRGTRVGGQVVDSLGQPVKGVEVEVRRVGGGTKADQNSNSRLGTWLAEGEGAAVTDENGMWSINNVPAGNDVDLNFKLTHPEFLSDTRWQTPARYQVDLPQLRSEKAKLTLDRGARITGTITDPDGKPVSQALVVWGDQPYWEGGSQEIKSEENGEFKTQAFADGEIRLTVVAEGLMPHTRMVNVKKDQMQPLSIQLQKGKKLHVQFVDKDGKPLAKTYMSLDNWRGSSGLYNHRHSSVIDSKIPYISNEQGEFVWDWAPADSVTWRVYNRDLNVAQEFELVATGEAQTITLAAPFAFQGKIVSAKDNSPINDFTITPVTYSSNSEAAQPIVQSGSQDSYSKSEFKYDRAFSMASRNVVAFRIDALGYHSVTTKKYYRDSPSDPVTIQLEPAEIASGTIVWTNGKPVKDAFVRIIGPHDSFLVNGLHSYLSNDHDPAITSDNNGQFQFMAPDSRYAIVAATDYGYAEQYCDPKGRPKNMKLEAWSSVEGQLFQDGKPVADSLIFANPIRALGNGNPHVQDSFQTRTDINGRFVFEKLPPVPTTIRAYLSPWRDFNITSARQIPIDLQPGERHSVNLGGEGIQITGKVKLIGDGSEGIEFRYGLNYLVAKNASVKVPVHAQFKPEWETGQQKEYEEKLWGNLQTKEGIENHFVKINEDGTFLINGVQPGNYRFLIKMYEPPSGCLVDPVGYAFVEFSTDDYQVNGNSIDMGTIDVQLKMRPKVGETLPNFSFQDTKGKTRRVSEYRGKYVLIDYWATWCAPCIKSIPDVQKLVNDIADLNDAEVLSISLDEEKDRWLDTVGSKQMTWGQGIVGDIKDTNSGKAMGISSVPHYIVLDPQGTIVYRGYVFADAVNALKTRE